MNVALAKAKAVVENPDNYAKSDVTKILQDLQKALKVCSNQCRYPGYPSDFSYDV
ncbi:hypothetical protein NXX53_20880 [Bacteroides salyersiae]|nr:hypothetical protein [Bacteroides salyersiae]